MLNDIHGQFAQVLVTTVLEHAGYRVLRLGCEEIVSEIRSMQIGRGMHLQLPERLSALPDLLVVDQETGRSLMLEVKFRRRIGESELRGIRTGFARQFELWPEAMGIIVSPEPPVPKPSRHQDYVRLVGPEDLGPLAAERSLERQWAMLSTLGSCFARVHDVPGFHGEIDRALEGMHKWVGSARD